MLSVRFWTSTTAAPTQRRALRRRRATARRQWFLHRTGVISLPRARLHQIYTILQGHHSRDTLFLKRIADTMATNTPWRCVNCRQLRTRSATHCQTCRQPWQVVLDKTYMSISMGAPKRHRRPTPPTGPTTSRVGVVIKISLAGIDNDPNAGLRHRRREDDRRARSRPRGILLETVQVLLPWSIHQQPVEKAKSRDRHHRCHLLLFLGQAMAMLDLR